MFDIEPLKSDPEKIKSFFEIQRGRSLFVGGMDRAGTTKVGEIFHRKLGLFVPEVFLAVEVSFACGASFNYSKLENFFDSYQGKYFEKNKFALINSVEEVFKATMECVHDVSEAPIIETSPRNLENYRFLSDNVNAGFIFMVRDLDQVWASYRKNGWRPRNKSNFISHYLHKLQLLNLVKDKDNVIICDYNDIAGLERISSTMPRCYQGLDVDSVFRKFQDYTVRQHKLVSAEFRGVHNNVSFLSALANRNSFIYSSYLGKRKNKLWVRVLIEALERLT